MALTVKKKILPRTNRNHPEVYVDAEGDMWILVHETGNTGPGADAEMHAVFVYNGGGSSSVSFHLTVDQTEAWQMMEFKWIGWHASDGCDNRATDWGCFRSIAIETCVNDGNRYKDTTRRNLAILISMIINGDPALDFGGIDHRRFSVDRIRTHNQSALDRKWCPTYMLNEGYIPILVLDVRARVGVTPAVGAIVPGDLVKYTGTERLNVRKGASTTYAVGFQLEPDEVVTIKDGPFVNGGYTWYDIIHPVHGTGWAAGNWFVEVPKPTPPPPAKVYAPRYVVSELAALKKEDADTAARMVLKNGTKFITIWDEVEATTTALNLQFAYDGAKETEAPSPPGTRRWVSHVFEADNGKDYYYDERANRLIADQWKRVHD